MALDLERMREVAHNYDKHASKELQLRYRAGAEMVMAQLAEDLPALSEVDRSAVAWFIAQLFVSARGVPLMKVSDMVADTSVSYSIAACRLIGLIP